MIYYVPLTIPFATRSRIAVALTLVCLIVLFVVSFSTEWYTATFSINVAATVANGTANGASPSQIATFEAMPSTFAFAMGPWKMRFRICGGGGDNVTRQGEQSCDLRDVLFDDCSDAFFPGRLRGIWAPLSQIEWCPTSASVMHVAFAMLISASVLGVVAVAVAFFRERFHGPVSVAVFLLATIAVIMIAIVRKQLTDTQLVAARDAIAQQGTTVFTEEKGSRFALILADIIATILFFAAGLTSSLFCCRPREGPAKTGSLPSAVPEPVVVAVAAINEPVHVASPGTDPGAHLRDQERRSDHCRVDYGEDEFCEPPTH